MAQFPTRFSAVIYKSITTTQTCIVSGVVIPTTYHFILFRSALQRPRLILCHTTHMEHSQHTCFQLDIFYTFTLLKSMVNNRNASELGANYYTSLVGVEM